MSDINKQRLTTPDPCDNDIYKNGSVVMVVQGGMLAIDGFVAEASRLGVKMDWHYVGGRAVVKTLGDVSIARDNLKNSMPRICN